MTDPSELERLADLIRATPIDPPERWQPVHFVHEIDPAEVIVARIGVGVALATLAYFVGRWFV